MEKIQRYNKKFNYSYCLGAFPSMELINKKPDLVERVYISPDYKNKDELTIILEEKNIRYDINSKLIDRLAKKGNVFVIAVFKKFEAEIIERDHVVLYEISDMGNLGTIIRTMVGFGVRDLALVGNTCDIYNPKVIRASMGAIFSIRFSFFESIEDYMERFNNNLYFFMLSNKDEDSIYKVKKNIPFSLVMGNEGRGLPEEFAGYGTRIFIPQSQEVDSFNLPIATAIGLYEFRR